ncbi:MAG: M48 family metalloprotease [Desulfoprunum sp.]|uniref:M48 family metalloprotease n=1 Tax=Desulfoprunum sp. TaxID=2020866 RepID=UPI003C71C9E0
MIYTNLLIFLVAIFLFSMDAAAEAPLLPGWLAAIVCVMLLAGYDRLCRYIFARKDAFVSAGYFRAERTLMIGALFFFLATLYLCDAKYYLAVFSFGNRLPAMVNFFGLALFLAYLSLMWRIGRINYGKVFGRRYPVAVFIGSNIKSNLPIVLPWVVLSLLYDLTALVPSPPLHALLASQWGDLIFFSVFLLFVMFFFPPLVRRLWGCEKLPEGPLKEHLTRFCSRQQFSAELYLWPLFEGQALTAGVMGIVPGLRYVLLTPAIIETMSLAELEAVMAHEIGHVKKGHLLLYVLLIGGFSVLTAILAQPLIYLLLSREFFYSVMAKGQVSPDTVLTLAGAVPLLIVMIIYFRYIFGYFIRNFERQADLHVFSVLGSSHALISAFEKIAALSGDIRDKPSWHHFGLGERIACLEKSEKDPENIGRHNRKVRYSLIGYVVILATLVGLVQLIPTAQLARQYEESFAEVVLLEKARQEPEKALWKRLLGDLMVSRQLEAKAFEAYEQALALEPANPEIMNNLAWLLLTSVDPSLRDPGRALTLARSAVIIQPRGYIFDTLATAYWANDLVEEAVASERQAIIADPGQRKYYQAQIERFIRHNYQETLKRRPGTDDRAGGNRST